MFVKDEPISLKIDSHVPVQTLNRTVHKVPTSPKISAMGDAYQFVLKSVHIWQTCSKKSWQVFYWGTVYIMLLDVLSQGNHEACLQPITELSMTYGGWVQMYRKRITWQELCLGSSANHVEPRYKEQVCNDAQSLVPAMTLKVKSPPQSLYFRVESLLTSMT